MRSTRLLASTAATLFAATVAAQGAVNAAPPAATAFLEAWAKVDSYTATDVVHETDGKTTQDRTYKFQYLKPHYARIDIVDGPGKGGGAVWAGGDTVRGHQGGFLSGIKLQVSIHDSRAVSLRGDTIDYAAFESEAQQVRAAKEISEGAASVEGQPVDTLTITYPAGAADGITKRVIALSKSTHLPVRRSTYTGDTLVKQETFSDVKLNVGLKPDDFT